MLRISLADDEGMYEFPLKSHGLIGLFAPAGVTDLRRANRWLEANTPEEEIVVRLGLARGWDGNEYGWSPRRCYIQVNNVICPVDHSTDVGLSELSDNE